METETLADKLRKAQSDLFEEEKRIKEEKRKQLESILDNLLAEIETKMLIVANWNHRMLEFTCLLDYKEQVIVSYETIMNFPEIPRKYVKRLRLLAEKHGVKLITPSSEIQHTMYGDGPAHCTFKCPEEEK